jgi:hypothetical protein
LSLSKSSTANSEDLSPSSIGLNFGISQESASILQVTSHMVLQHLR